MDLNEVCALLVLFGIFMAVPDTRATIIGALEYLVFRAYPFIGKWLHGIPCMHRPQWSDDVKERLAFCKKHRFAKKTSWCIVRYRQCNCCSAELRVDVLVYK